MIEYHQHIRQNYRLVRAGVLTSAVFVIAGTGAVATTLQELLAKIDANPNLATGGLYLNYSEVLAFDPQSTTLLIDGSVIIAHNAQIITGEEATTPGTGPVSEPEDPTQTLPLTIATSVVGGSNQGMIDIDHTYYMAMFGAPQSGAIMPGNSIMAVNATSTQAFVTGSVAMLSDGPTPPNTEISTSVIGANNVGSINVMLQNGGIRRSGP